MTDVTFAFIVNRVPMLADPGTLAGAASRRHVPLHPLDLILGRQQGFIEGLKGRPQVEHSPMYPLGTAGGDMRLTDDQWSSFAAGIAVTLAVVFPLYGVSQREHWSEILERLAVTGGVIVAIITFRASLSRHRREDTRAASENLMKEAIKTLERAYELFMSGAERSLPRPDRVLWLTVARMLTRYQLLRQRVAEEDHLAILEENEEYYRHRFYEVFESKRADMTPEYFRKGNETMFGNIVEPASLAILLKFIHWPFDRPDPLEALDIEALFAEGIIPINYTGVEQYAGGFARYSNAIHLDGKQAITRRTEAHHEKLRMLAEGGKVPYRTVRRDPTGSE